jgi:hypothetical protein
MLRQILLVTFLGGALVGGVFCLGCKKSGENIPLPQGMSQKDFENPNCLFWEFHGTLNDKQKAALDRLKAKKEVLKTEVVKVNWNVADNGRATVCLLTGVCMPISDFVFIKDKTGNGFLKWENKQTGSIVFISKTDNSFTGLIYTGKHVFALEPLADGLHALSEIDQSKLPKD